MSFLVIFCIFMCVWLVQELVWTAFMMCCAKLDKDPTSNGAYAAIWMVGVLIMPIIAAFTTGLYYLKVSP